MKWMDNIRHDKTSAAWREGDAQRREKMEEDGTELRPSYLPRMKTKVSMTLLT